MYDLPEGGFMARPRKYGPDPKGWEEKTVMLTIRVPESIRNRFLEICRSEDTTAAREIRAFLKDFVNARKQGELFTKGAKK
jgi:hypothetical protein